jgi:hypothetical protein
MGQRGSSEILIEVPAPAKNRIPVAESVTNHFPDRADLKKISPAIKYSKGKNSYNCSNSASKNNYSCDYLYSFCVVYHLLCV